MRAAAPDDHLSPTTQPSGGHTGARRVWAAARKYEGGWAGGTYSQGASRGRGFALSKPSLCAVLSEQPASASGFLRSAYLGEPAFQEAALGGVLGAFEGGLVCGCRVGAALDAAQQVSADRVKQVIALEL